MGYRFISIDILALAQLQTGIIGTFTCLACELLLPLQKKSSVPCCYSGYWRDVGLLEEEAAR